MRSFLASLCFSVSDASFLSKIEANDHKLSLTRTAENQYGNSSCKCVGISFGTGELQVPISGQDYPFPADLGTSCKAWEEGTYPGCDGSASQEAWCSDAWCYVDPCSCNIETLPKVSSYFADGRYHGMTLYYSYATCGATDSYTSANHATACVNQQNEEDCEALSTGEDGCAWDEAKQQCGGKEIVEGCEDLPEPDPAVAGDSTCPCIGLDGLTGEVTAKIDGAWVPQTPSYGSSCQPWDQTGTPSCGEENAPAWCANSWCYVDPCNCDLEVPPVIGGDYFPYPNTTYHGYSVYYSYTTCGADDTYTGTEHASACVNQDDETDCTALQDANGDTKCAWIAEDSKCIGKELVQECTSA